MKTKWLFPHRYRLIGWLIFIPCALLGSINLYADYDIRWLTFAGNNFTNELAGLGVITGLLLIAFSREILEDEMIGQLRLEALQWSVYANYLILAVAMLTVYDVAFFSVMIYNMFTVLLVFIARFRWLLHRNTNVLLL